MSTPPLRTWAAASSTVGTKWTAGGAAGVTKFGAPVLGAAVVGVVAGGGDGVVLGIVGAGGRGGRVDGVGDVAEATEGWGRADPRGPITFTDRVRGKSKMSMKVAAEQLSLVTWWGARPSLQGRGHAHRGRIRAHEAAVRDLVGRPDLPV